MPDTDSDFPSSEDFVDFAGQTRTFRLKVFELPWGFTVQAIEDVEGDDGYEFTAASTVDPFHALGSLRQKIPRLLCTRHLLTQQGRQTMPHDRLRGRVSYGGVVVDGIFLDFEAFTDLLQTYEGFQFDLKIVDPLDELD